MANYPDTPWWSNLVAVLLTAIVSVIGTLYFMKTGPPGAPPSAPSIGGLLKDTVTYIPHILLLFGVLADMFTMEGVYSIPSLVGLLSIPLNWVFKYFWVGIQEVFGKIVEVLSYKATVPPIETRSRTGSTVISGGGKFFDDYDGCTVQGFEWAKSKYAPQTLVVTATVFSYYMFDLIANRGWTNATATIVVFLVLFAGEALVVGSCATGDADEPSTAIKAIAAFSEGLLFGGTSYAIVQAYYPTRLPSSVISPFPRKSVSDLKRGEDGRYVDEDGNYYTVLPNGQAIPDLSDEESKKSWGGKLGSGGSGFFGTGSPAIPASCSSKK